MIDCWCIFLIIGCIMGKPLGHLFLYLSVSLMSVFVFFYHFAVVTTFSLLNNLEPSLQGKISALWKLMAKFP